MTGAKETWHHRTTEPVSTELRDRLRLTLAESRISQMELARCAGITPRNITKLCRGDSVNVTLPTLLKLAAALGCSIDWLVGRAVQGPSPAAVRHAIGQAGGRVMEFARSPIMDPINRNAGIVSRRGRQVRSVLAPVAPPSSGGVA